MLSVLVPVILLFVIVLVPSIPKIGGNVKVGLLVAGLTAALFGGLGPVEMIKASIDGIDRLSWVIMLSVFGSIYAQTQARLGTVDATLNGLRSMFGNTPMGLIVAIYLTLVLAGSLLGDAIAAATVIGFLVIHSLHELKLKPEQIGMIILLGASLGSIMPPITQAVFLSASLLDIDPDPVVKLAYLTVSIGVIFAIAESYRFVRNKKLPPELLPKETFWEIMRGRGYTFIPLAILVVIIVAGTGFGYDIYTEWGFLATVVAWLNSIPIVKGLAFKVVFSIIIVTAISFLFTSVRQNGKQVFKEGLSKVSQTAQIQICAGIMIGLFYAAGLIDTVKYFAEHLEPVAIKLGGATSTVLVGMLTGSQTTAQTVIISIVGPVLTHLGVDPVNVALGASHIAAAGQNMPPVGLTAFVVCGLIGGMINQKVDPVRVMILALPNSIYFLIVGLIAWLI